MALDDQPSTGVISTHGAAMWRGVGYVSLEAWETAPNVYDVYASSSARLCPGTYDPSWVLIEQGVPGPIVVHDAVRRDDGGGR